MAVQLGAGIRFLHHGRLFEMTGELPGNKFEAKDLNFGVPRTFTLDEILRDWHAGKTIFEHKGKRTKKPEDSMIRRFEEPDFTLVDEELKEIARRKYENIRPLLVIEEGPSTLYCKPRAEQLKEEGIQVSAMTLYRDWKAFSESGGDIRSLVPNYANRGPRGKLLSFEEELILKRVLDEMESKNEPFSIKRIRLRVRRLIDQENKFRDENEEPLKCPSESTIRRRIRERTSYDTIKTKHGQAYARQKYGQFNYQEKPEAPNHRWEADHTTLDLIVVHDETRMPFGRATITTITDRATGCVVGSHVGFDGPSYTSVMHALRHAIGPKTYVKELYPDIQNEWMTYGVPATLVVDNGKEFVGNDLKDACLQLGIELVHCAVKMPWWKGAVERHFRTLNQKLLHSIPGTTAYAHLLDRTDYNPEKNAIISFSEFIEIYHTWVIDIYHESPNKGVKGIPRKLWEKGILEYGRPQIPESIVDWEILLMKVEGRSIQNYGIRHNHIRFNSPELSELRIEYERHGQKPNVRFKYDPTDLSNIYVFDEFKKSFIKVPCTSHDLPKPLNEYTLNIIVKMLNEESKTVNESAIAEAYERIDQIINEGKKKTAKAWRRVARMKGIGMDKVISGTPTAFSEKKSRAVGKESYSKLEVRENDDWGVSFAE